jgi:hypothetical protein
MYIHNRKAEVVFYYGERECGARTLKLCFLPFSLRFSTMYYSSGVEIARVNE